jgi:thiamine pyrophosphate-dependent acetolactate synthase large subunit-like protein|tara:strand:+ start:1735 stop:3537 length:1803 start_codon:yes stop_codon:yes gene_type:complete
MEAKVSNKKQRLTDIDIPANVDSEIGFGSDVAAQMLRRLSIPYIALNPGASYRGLHDSLVNHLGNHEPEMLMCLHEEHAVAIAQGYAKAGGEPMAVALHSNVGLMHGTMAIFNAWCDRQPMLIMGATGPVDAALRRPWIDWLHTAQDQGALVRNYVKYDDQPGSIEAIPESMLRAWQQAGTSPCGPTYVCLDAAIQEDSVDQAIDFPDETRFRPAPPVGPSIESLNSLVELLQTAKNPVFLMGRGGFSQSDWDARVSLAELTQGKMLTDLKTHSVVPTDHPLHVGEPFNKLGEDGRQAIKEADLIVSLGWVDLGGVIRQSLGSAPVSASVVHISQDMHLHNGWGRETFQLPPTDLLIVADPDETLRALAARLDLKKPVSRDRAPLPEFPEPTSHLNLTDVARELKSSLGDQKVTFAALARAWPTEYWPFVDSLSYLGKDGGGGVGSGPGLCVGAALKLKDEDRFVVGIIGDGDCLMGINAFWTAARYQLPVLIVVGNNRSYYNDELHQEGVAKHRGRDTKNRWIGQTIDHPAPDISSIARGLGVDSIGPIKDQSALADAIRKGVEVVRSGKPFLIDVHIDPGHGRELTESMAERSLAQKS